MTRRKRHLVTAALPYGNGPIHIGHLAGAYIPADIYVRYLREKGEDVAFICGMDEHGVPITLQAKKEGIKPQELVDKYYSIQKKSFEDFGISFDIFHRTTAELHHQTAQEFFLTLYEKDVFIEEESEQYYDQKEQTFLADRYIMGTCPKCGYDQAYGDQCEKCGSSLSPKELKDPKSVLSGNPPILKKTRHWYLPLDKYESWLKEWIGSKKDWKVNVAGQCKSWLDAGLQPRAMSRDLDWGVKVPLKDAEGKVLYVWFDAPIGYISATREWAMQRAIKNPEKFSGNDWEKYWKSDDSSLVHFIGKDNIVFHCIIFPAMLKAHGDYILPENVPANEFLNLEGKKLSTSRNWAVWLNEYLEEFPGKQDVLRYVLTSILPETKDNEFTWEDFRNKNNNELVAILGNFYNRVMVLTHKYFEGIVPPAGEHGSQEKEVIRIIGEAPGKIEDSLSRFRQREALAEMMNLARAGNKYLTETEPWKMIRDDKSGTGAVLNLCLQILANLSILSKPFLPFTAEKIRESLFLKDLGWEDAGLLTFVREGSKIGEAGHLFEKLEESVVEKQREKLKAKASATKEKKEEVPEISFEDFMKTDLRVARIKSAEKVKKADKLLKIELELGDEVRTVVSGIATQFSPEEIIGKEVVYLGNLAPKKIRGVVSRGMILMAEDNSGKLSFLSPEAGFETGAKIR